MSEKYLTINDFSLKQYNSMGLQACAEIVYVPVEISGISQLFKEHQLAEFITLGKGSNIILSQDRYATPFILTNLLNNLEYNGEYIVAECGTTLSQLSWFALEKSVPGFEFLEDIPGSVGGALFMNAGTYEDCIGNLVHSVMIYDYTDGQTKELKKDDISSFWGKRDSYFQHHPCFIVKVVFEANSTGNYEDILDKMLDIKKKRYLKQPREYPSAGSVFKRPYVNGEPRYIWKLFDEAGLRGYRIGDAQVSEKHPGFIVNIGNATGKDIVELMNYCKQVVFDKYGIRIEEEWKIV